MSNPPYNAKRPKWIRVVFVLNVAFFLLVLIEVLWFYQRPKSIDLAVLPDLSQPRIVVGLIGEPKVLPELIEGQRSVALQVALTNFGTPSPVNDWAVEWWPRGDPNRTEPLGLLTNVMAKHHLGLLPAFQAPGSDRLVIQQTINEVKTNQTVVGPLILQFRFLDPKAAMADGGLFAIRYRARNMEHLNSFAVGMTHEDWRRMRAIKR